MSENKLTLEEEKQLQNLFANLDTKDLKKVAESISMLIKAFNGQTIEEDSVVTKLTDIKNIVERSRFPTYPLVAKQIYLRLISLFYPEICGSFEDWADNEAHTLISYKGLEREEWVEQTKAGSTAPQEFYIGQQKQGQPEANVQQKAHWWNRPKKEESELSPQEGR
jgi:hypothetical protein